MSSVPLPPPTPQPPWDAINHKSPVFLSPEELLANFLLNIQTGVFSTTFTLHTLLHFAASRNKRTHTCRKEKKQTTMHLEKLAKTLAVKMTRRCITRDTFFKTNRDYRIFKFIFLIFFFFFTLQDTESSTTLTSTNTD